MILMRNVTLLDRTHYKTICPDFPEKQQRRKGFKVLPALPIFLKPFNYNKLQPRQIRKFIFSAKE
jgi:hypothetical protein